MRISQLQHKFVEFIPSQLEEGVLYVSMSYATAAHLCASGCGEKVVTPLTPTDWSLKFDGESVSLSPSIGNWSFACRSHYWIRQGQIRWAGGWSDERVAEGRQRDRSRKQARYSRDHPKPDEQPRKPSLFRKLWQMIHRS